MSVPSRKAAKPLIQTTLSFLPLTTTNRSKSTISRPAARMSSWSTASSSSPEITPSRSQRQPPRYNLNRFLTAQNSHQIYATALSEIRRGSKDSHWIWFIFPQIAGLGQFPSPTARRYAISSLGEAEAYLAHPVLGGRLREISAAVLESEVEDVGTLMGNAVDKDKLRSSMTLFKRAADGLPVEERKGEAEADGQGNGVFKAVLEKYYEGEEDAETVRLLEEGSE